MPGWKARFAEAGEPPGETASLREKMAYKLRTAAVMGFRQFSLRGLAAVTGEWRLVCLGYTLRRLHVMTTG